MKTGKRSLSKVLSLALAFLMAMTMAMPAMAVGSNPNTENLTITIHNNTGLPAMTADQFKVYQLFTGTANREKDPDFAGDDKEGSTWAVPDQNSGQEEKYTTNWNNYTLADIDWGESIKTENQGKLLKALAELETTDNPWLTKGTDGKENPFSKLTEKSSAADLAKILEKNPQNAFLQGFANFLLNGNNKGSYLEPLKNEDEQDITGTVNGSATSPQDQTLTYTVPGPGYYLFAETGTHSGSGPNDEPINDAMSEYILAVLGDQDINLKASVPDVDKEIVDGDNGKKGDVAGYTDTVTFKLTGTLPKNFFDFTTYEYIFHDTLSTGLSYVPGSLKVEVVFTAPTTQKVTLKDVTADDQPDKTIGYTLEAPNKEENGGTITVSFADLLKITAENDNVGTFNVWEVIKEKYKDIIDTDVKIVVTYDATVNTDAVIGNPDNPEDRNLNDVYLEYSNDPNSTGKGKTETKTVYVYAFGLDLEKIGSDKTHGEGLEGAGFLLQNSDGKYAKFAKHGEDDPIKGENRQIVGWVDEDQPLENGTTLKQLMDNYRNAKEELEKAKNEDQNAKKDALKKAKDALKEYLLESDANGHIPNVYGLDEGKYTLSELVTPDGYNTMDPFTFTIDAKIDEQTGDLLSVTYTHDDESVVYDSSIGHGSNIFKSGLLPQTLVNQKAPFLPFTGGIGTVIFYVLGVTMIAGAAIYLVRARKRRNGNVEQA